jgi:hypothetical protein
MAWRNPLEISIAQRSQNLTDGIVGNQRHASIRGEKIN